MAEIPHFLSKTILICEPEYDFEIISLVSSVKDYRLCWLLNTHLRFDFIRIENLVVPQQKKKAKGYFNVFAFYDDADKMDYFLMENKENGNFLLPELKTVDYILKLEGVLAEEKKEELLNELKQVPYVEAVFSNSLGELKNKANLLF
jgi:hypothetical protein